MNLERKNIVTNLYESILGVQELPVFVNKEQALKDLVKMWEDQSTTVADVVARRASFESIVRPIVEENLRIRFPYYYGRICRSKEFRREAGVLKERLGGVLALGELVSPIKFPWISSVVTLALSGAALWVLSPNYWRQGVLIALGVIALEFMWMWAGFGDRRNNAKRVLERAKFLDSTLHPDKG